jgi:hypothetical protein
VARLTGSGAKRLLEKTSPSAAVRGECYVREAFLEEPCAAEVLNGELAIYTVTGKELRIPLSQLRVTRVKRKNIAGRYPWFWKTVFYIDAPGTSGLRLGVAPADAEAWERALGADESPAAAG